MSLTCRRRSLSESFLCLCELNGIAQRRHRWHVHGISIPPLGSNGVILSQFVTSGPDGALWFTELGGNAVGRITTAGEITQYPLPSAAASPEGITTGSDGALWFDERDANKIGRITTAGAITEYPVPTGLGAAVVITSGPDGALWFIGGLASLAA